jgi:type VI secretion system protein ImpJ
MKRIIHWNEGLFLQPQHLQILQREVISALSIERNLQRSYPYGVLDIKISEDSLSNKKIQFERFSAIMPSGAYVELGKNLSLDPVDIRERFSKKNESFHVYLGIPLYNARRANTQFGKDGSRSVSKYLYSTFEDEVADENTGDSEKTIEFLSMNGRILVEGDSFDGLDVIPLFRVMQGVGENLGQPRVAPDFCGPCTAIRAFPALLQMLTQLVEQISASRKDLFRKYKSQGFNREQVQSNHLDLMLRSSYLVDADVELSEMVENGVAHPLTVYNELKKLYGRLICLNPETVKGEDTDPLSVIEDYDHENPFMPLKVLSKKLREVLGDVVIPDYLEVEFERKEDHYLGLFEEKHFSQSDNIFLGIETKKVPSDELVKLVEDIDVFKFVPISMSKKVLRGIRIKEESHVPHMLPRKSFMYYFRVIPGGEGSVWNKIQKEKKAVIEWNGFKDSDFSIRCFMTSID